MSILSRYGSRSVVVSLACVLAVVAVGAGVYLTHAASSTVSSEAEAGTKSVQATQVTDTTASAGKAVKFKAATSGTTGACTLKPSASTVGASGTLNTISPGDIVLNSGDTLENTYITNGGITINGDNVTVRNVRAAGGMFIYLSNGVLVDHFTGNDAMAISSSTGVTVQYSDIGPTTDDGIHVTSDRGSMNQNIKLLYNYIHDPQVSDTAHYDGTQVRGVDGLTINCSNYDSGTYQHMYNSEVYLEDANGGNSNVTISSNWLYGAGYTVMMDTAANVSLTNNHIGGDIHWGPCYKNPSGSYPGFMSSGNIDDATGQPLALCQ